MAKNLLLGIFVLFSVFFLACFLCYRWASVSLDFLTCPAHFWGRVRAAVSEQVSETLRGSGASSKEMAPVPMAVQYWALGNHFWGEKGSDGQIPCGTGLECSMACPRGLWGGVSMQNRRGRGQLLLCQLWGVCTVVEYRDVFGRGGEMQKDTLFSKITFLPIPVRRITWVDL